MELKKLTTITSIILGLLGTYFVTKSFLSISPSSIADQSYLHSLESSSLQKADRICGFYVVLISALLALVNNFMKDVHITKKGLTVYISIVLLVAFGTFKLDGSLYEQYSAECKNAFVKNQLVGLFKDMQRRGVYKDDIDIILFDAKTYCNLYPNNRETFKDFVQRLSFRAMATIPSNIDLDGYSEFELTK